MKAKFPHPDHRLLRRLKCGVAEEAGAAGVMGVAVVARLGVRAASDLDRRAGPTEANGQAIYQELVDHYGFLPSYESVKRFVRGLRHADPHQFDRLEFHPGEEAQVDYGEGALTVDPNSGRYRRPRLFVMTLRYSRRSFRRVVWKSGQQVWAQLHEEAFRYFGGVPSYIVLDNLKEGVIKPDLYEPELNPVYSVMLAHYGVVADPPAWAIPIGKEASRMRSSIPRARRWPDGVLRRWKPRTSS